jgi:hypothetical protein
VKNFKSAGRRKSKEVALIESKVQRNLNINDIQAALRQVSAETSPVIVENAAFRMLRAEVYCLCKPARTTEAREDFQYCVDHSYENIEGMRRWFELERHAGSSANQEKICDYVIEGKSYADNVKNEFFSRKATVLYFRGRDRGVSTVDGFGLIEASLIYSVRAFNYFFSIGGDSNKNFRYVRSTAFSLVNSAKAIDYDKQLLKVFEEIQKEHGFLPDPLFDPFLEALNFFSEGKGGETGKRRAGLIKSVNARLGKSLRFELPEMNRDCLKHLENLTARRVR